MHTLNICDLFSIPTTLSNVIVVSCTRVFVSVFREGRRLPVLGPESVEPRQNFNEETGGNEKSTYDVWTCASGRSS